VPHRLGVAKIVDRDDLELTTALKPSPKKVPTNPPKPVNPHACFSHELSLNDDSERVISEAAEKLSGALSRAAADAGSAGVGRNRASTGREIVGGRENRRNHHAGRSAADSDDEWRAGGEAPRTTSPSG
jgi:hypothetical protein